MTQVITDFLTDGFTRSLALNSLKSQISALCALSNVQWAEQHFLQGVLYARPPFKTLLPLVTYHWYSPHYRDLLLSP